MSTHILGSSKLEDTVVAYRRLPTPRKIILWTGLSFIAILLLVHGSRPGAPFHLGLPPPRPPHRGPSLNDHIPPTPPQERLIWEQRKEIIRAAFQHAYGAYEQFAFGYDELKPLSNGTKNNLNGWGLTIVDGLDTMLMMDLAPEVDRAMEFIETLDFRQPAAGVGFFETMIRYVGGLLSASYLASVSANPNYRDSYAPMLLQKAEELSDVLNGAFQTESGLPDRWIKVKDGQGEPKQSGGTGSLAEMASCQMEFKYLSHVTKEPKYFRNSQRVMDVMQREQGKTQARLTKNHDNGTVTEELSMELKTGLWTNYFHLTDGQMFGSGVSAGAMGDSAYEYLLKQYLLSGRAEKHILDMYLKAMDGVINHLLYLSPKNNLLYMTDLGQWATPSGQFEHLSCYMPGVLALGARLLDPSYPWPHPPRHARSESSFSSNFTSEYQPPYSHRLPPRTPVHIDEYELRQTLDLHMRAAKGLAYTCWSLYASSRSGIGPEIVTFDMPHLPEGDTGAPSVLTRDRYNAVQWGPRVAKWERSGRKGGLVGTEEESGRNEGMWQKEVEVQSESGVVPDNERDWKGRDERYLLRPEAIEAMYVLWKTTGDKKWRERGWKMFDAVERHTRTEFGYASAHRVNGRNPKLLDDMPSFFLAETLKYSYLLALEPEDDPLPLDQIVFNTEAHPLPIFEWTAEERSQYNIH